MPWLRFAALMQRWRGETARVQEMHTIESVFAEVSAKVDAYLSEMGDQVRAGCTGENMLASESSGPWRRCR